MSKQYFWDTTEQSCIWLYRIWSGGVGGGVEYDENLLYRIVSELITMR